MLQELRRKVGPVHLRYSGFFREWIIRRRGVLSPFILAYGETPQEAIQAAFTQVRW